MACCHHPRMNLTSFLLKQSHIYYTCAAKNKRNSKTQNEVIIGGFNCENFFNKKLEVTKFLIWVLISNQKYKKHDAKKKNYFHFWFITTFGWPNIPNG